MNSHLISIIIPAFNIEDYLEKCLNSLLNQTYSNVEILIINDCSTDNTYNVAKNIEENDSRIKIVNLPSNVGQMTARKIGFNYSKGDFIMFVDGDDWLPKDSVENLYNHIIYNASDICSGQYVLTNGKNNILTSKYSLPYGTDSRSVFKALLNNKYGHQMSCKLFRREILSQNCYETIDNMRNSEDALMFYQIIKNCKNIVHCDKVVYYYYYRPSSSSNSLSQKSIDDITHFRKYLLNLFPEDPELYRLAYRNVTLTFCNMCWQGYKKMVFNSLHSFKMTGLLKMSEYSKFFSLSESLKIWIKIHFATTYNKRIFIKRMVRNFVKN